MESRMYGAPKGIHVEKKIKFSRGHNLRSIIRGHDLEFVPTIYIRSHDL